ncbi:MAG: LysR family transcriptional regulator [Clostridiales bacterium]|nr:LysR family transcriptional regulator [Clostridiales bacterium]
MNIQQLRYFDAVCTCGSLSKAAQKLFISQQGISMSIQRLETEFSCRLLARSAKGIRLTEDGKFLWEHAKNIIREADACEAYFAKKQPSTRSVKIASSYGALSEFAANIIQSFEAEHPNIRLHVTEYMDNACDDIVLSEEADLGFSVGPIDDTLFDSIPLFTRRLCLVVNKENPLAQQKMIRTGDLDHLPMIMVDKNFKPPHTFLERCRSFGVNPDVRVEVGEVISVHRLVAKNENLCGLSVESVARDIQNPNVVAIPLENSSFNWMVYLIKKKGYPLMPSAQMFEDYMLMYYHMDSGDRPEKAEE